MQEDEVIAEMKVVEVAALVTKEGTKIERISEDQILLVEGIITEEEVAIITEIVENQEEVAIMEAIEDHLVIEVEAEVVEKEVDIEVAMEEAITLIETLAMIKGDELMFN